MTPIRINANVRRVGAIGTFYPVGFVVRVADPVTRDTVLAAWQEANTDTWELNNLIDWQRDPLSKDDKR